MHVTKRDGRAEPVEFDKITQRLVHLRDMEPRLREADVDVTRVAASVCSSVHDGIATARLDELAADVAVGLSTENLGYGTLAARTLVSNLQKNTSDSVVDTYESMAGLLGPGFMEVVRGHGQELQAMVRYERDYDFDFFGFKTMEKMYLTRVEGVVVERPQHMWLRVAVALWGDTVEGVQMQRVRETYEFLSTRRFTHASPTLFNAGLKRQQLASCFLGGVEDDSIDGIFDALTKCARISKYGGGIGLHVSGVRSKGSHIRGTNGESDGLVPMLRVANAVASYVNQGGRRKGSIAVYIEPHHPDILDVLALKRNGGDEHLRARDLFYAVWVSDLFMRRVEASGTWSLFDPATCPGLERAWGAEYEALYERYEVEGLATRTLPAQDLWFEILRSQIETGTPYILYKDAANAKSNQQNLGTIRCSNLCVSGDTRILTATGYHPIAGLVGRRVEVWNGERFSETIVAQTGVAQKLVTVALDNGTELRCTPYHKFYVETGSRPSETSRAVTIQASELQTGDRLIKYDLPTLVSGKSDRDPREAYTRGFFSAAGYVDVVAKTAKISVSDADKKAALDLRAGYTSKTDCHYRATYTLGAAAGVEKFEVPINSSPADKLRWLEGYVDGDGSVIHDDGIENLQAASVSKEFLHDIQLMLQTLGVSSTVALAREAGRADMDGGSKMYDTKTLWRISIGSRGLRALAGMGFAPSRVRVTTDGGREAHHDTYRYTRVIGVTDHGEIGDTFCFNEPLRHAGVFEGVLTGQCSEIIEFTSADEVAVCNLGSLSLPAFLADDGATFDFQALMAATRVLARNLDRVIDITYYPIPEAETSNMRHRPVGVGVQGLQDVFFALKMPFESPEAAELNRRIFEAVYFAAIDTSCELAREHGVGAYSTFEGSPASQGRLQFDLWGVTPSDPQHDWGRLKADIAAHGLRNSLSVAPMPTASTANIFGNVESTEPVTSNIYSRRTLAGEFAVVNKHLVRDLAARGLWSRSMKDAILARDGSVQGIASIPEDVQRLYKTAWELSMKAVIDMAADRGAYVCQSQSLNLFVAEPTFKKLSSMHFYAWKKGLKTGCYYLRTKPAARAVQVTVAPAECVACSG